MFQKTHLKIFLGLLWFCILGTFIAPQWLDPQLPADVLSDLQKSYFYVYVPFIQYILLSLLFVSSVGLWFSKKWGRSLLLGYILLTWIFQIFKGPYAVYPWYSLFSDISTVVVGIIAGISFSDPINKLLTNQPSIITLKKFRIVVMMAMITFICSFAAAIITDNNLPASFIKFHVPDNNLSVTFFIMAFVIYILPSINLLFKSKIAKYLFTIISIGSVMSFFPDSVTEWDAFFGYMSIILAGCIIGLLYSAPLANEFSKLRNTTFFDASAICLIKFFNFSGRARRSEFWWFYLFSLLLPTKTLLGLIFMIPSFAVGARRLHDIGKSGWWQLLAFTFPIAVVVGYECRTMPAIAIIAISASVVSIIILLYWVAKKGNPGKNQYGDPVI